MAIVLILISPTEAIREPIHKLTDLCNGESSPELRELSEALTHIQDKNSAEMKQLHKAAAAFKVPKGEGTNCTSSTYPTSEIQDYITS